MEIVHKTVNEATLTKAQIENVQKEKDEWKMVGKYLRTRGLRLYAYNPKDRSVSEVDIKPKNQIEVVIEDNEMVPVDFANEEAQIISTDIHFEALNIKTATKRVTKYHNGNIKELCNLRIATGNGIKFY